MSNNMTAAAIHVTNAGTTAATMAPPDPWKAQACDRYVDLALTYAWWFLLMALVIGTIGAIVMVANSIGEKRPKGGETGGATFQQAADAVRALIEAFSKAPTWLAMLGGGVLLLWMAGTGISACAGIAVMGNESGANRATGNVVSGNTTNGSVTENRTANASRTQDEAGGGR